MNAEQSNQSFTDLVFEERNKNYGAYTLRTEYGTNLFASFLFALSGVTFAFCFYFLGKVLFSSPEEKVNVITDWGHEINIDPNKKMNDHKVITETHVVERHNTNRTTTHVIIRDSVDTQKKDSSSLLNHDLGGGKDNGKKGGGKDSADTGFGKKEPEPKKEVKKTRMPDVYPQFKGDLTAYLQKNIYYTEEAKEIGIHGTVYISFTVDTLGGVKDVALLKGLGFGLDEVALKAVKKMPRWEPGVMDGEKVEVIHQIPIKFIIK